MNCTEIVNHPDCEVVYVHGAVVSLLAKFLDISVPWVWILCHRPNRYVNWWEATVPLDVGGTVFSGSVRNLCFDLQMSTSDFISRAGDFDDHSLVLLQSREPMPDSLCLERIPEPQQNSVLIQNGATLRIYLPHAVETAQVQSFRKGYLASIIGKQEFG